MTDTQLAERLHYLLGRHIVDTGHAPDVRRLAELAGIPEADAARGLTTLNEIHGVILVPNSLTVWSLHPFALMPTRFWVTSRQGGWWANCAWCSLGLAAAIKQDVTVSTSDGGEASPLEFRIEGSQVSRPDLLMHFPYPPARWWDNPYCPCGNILFFSSEAGIDDWSRRHGHPKGAILDMRAAMGLAERWFGDYLSPAWHRKTPEEAAQVFAALGLDAEFWNIPGGFR